MDYKRALARESFRVSSEILEMLQDILPFQDGIMAPKVLEGIVEARLLRDAALRRIEENENQKARRNGKPAGLLPAPRSNHDGA